MLGDLDDVFELGEALRCGSAVATARVGILISDDHFGQSPPHIVHVSRCCSDRGVVPSARARVKSVVVLVEQSEAEFGVAPTVRQRLDTGLLGMRVRRERAAGSRA